MPWVVPRCNGMQRKSDRRQRLTGGNPLFLQIGNATMADCNRDITERNVALQLFLTRWQVHHDAKPTLGRLIATTPQLHRNYKPTQFLAPCLKMRHQHA